MLPRFAPQLPRPTSRCQPLPTMQGREAPMLQAALARTLRQELRMATSISMPMPAI
jgi:hypothetical protein